MSIDDIKNESMSQRSYIRNGFKDAAVKKLWFHAVLILGDLSSKQLAMYIIM